MIDTRVVIIAAALVATPAAATTDQFDLVCRGTVQWKPGGKSSPISARYRVDLSTGAWCRDKCETVQKIASVEPSRIVFQAQDRQFERDERSSETVDRTTGEWSDYSSGTDALGLFMRISGKCDAAPFSGLPTNKF